MNRRAFLSGIGALVGGIAIEKAIPFGRVWSFPKEIKCINKEDLRYAQVALLRDLFEKEEKYIRLSNWPLRSSCAYWERIVNAV